MIEVKINDTIKFSVESIGEAIYVIKHIRNEVNHLSKSWAHIVRCVGIADLYSLPPVRGTKLRGKVFKINLEEGAFFRTMCKLNELLEYSEVVDYLNY
ncbi:hypothetical protein [Scytonema sp. NUACC26]|uniref:hypothetical protein n=1 Tax=Scytonema sp. NUACC26 TaxID=3140176 RepID=UPI0034DC741E